MNGLELSEKFFTECYLPLLEQEYPEAISYISAGLVGEGSECFGFDDEASRDHDWGARFCVWISRAHAARFGKILTDLVKKLPNSFEGYKNCMGTMGRSGIFSAEGFYLQLLDRCSLPEDPSEWLDLPQCSLAASVNGKIFLNNCREFRDMREGLLAFYPEDVRLRLLAESAAKAAQTGQYNFLRCSMRKELLTARVIKSIFVENAADMIYLLNKTYKPFYKWTYRGLKDLPILGDRAYETFDRIMKCEDEGETVWAIEGISGHIIDEMKRQGLTNADSSFLMDHVRELLLRIRDEDLRTRPVLLKF